VRPSAIAPAGTLGATKTIKVYWHGGPKGTEQQIEAKILALQAW